MYVQPFDAVKMCRGICTILKTMIETNAALYSIKVFDSVLLHSSFLVCTPSVELNIGPDLVCFETVDMGNNILFLCVLRQR